jgi:hypothetical protein
MAGKEPVAFLVDDDDPDDIENNFEEVSESNPLPCRLVTPEA